MRLLVEAGDAVGPNLNGVVTVAGVGCSVEDADVGTDAADHYLLR